MFLSKSGCFCIDLGENKSYFVQKYVFYDRFGRKLANLDRKFITVRHRSPKMVNGDTGCSTFAMSEGSPLFTGVQRKTFDLYG